MEIIAFYLPQYHPTPDNDKWWGKGFTEWTNVGNAKPLFSGHYQPKVPADLGYYDLRLPEIKEEQAKLAREAGITGFCYYHYWFGNGKKELERPYEEMLESGQPNFPFCVCWANESWFQKMWNKDGAVCEKTELVKQLYPGNEDIISHFYYLLKAFKDPRYIKIDGKPLFVIYRPLDVKDLDEFIMQWQQLAIENGLPGIMFVGYTVNAREEYTRLLNLNLDKIIICNLAEPLYQGKKRSILKKVWIHAKRKLFNRPSVIAYKKAIKYLTPLNAKDANVYPTIIPNWDHTPRSGKGGYLFHKASPLLFYKHALNVLQSTAKKEPKENIIFLKSWNEWGEGNYMEPDLKYGHGYIDALRQAIHDNELYRESIKNKN